MNGPSKRVLSTIAIIIASVAFGVLISADLGIMRKSHAQSGAAPIQTPQGAVTSVTIPSFADVAARVTPAVVSIRTTEIVRNTMRNRGIDPFEFFFGQPHPRRRPADPNDDDARRELSGGSGFIISPDGYILTNNHVIEDASKVEVHYGADENGNGGHTVTAKVVGRDPATDIALLKIEGSNLPTVPLGDSDKIRKGDWAIAVGNPFQFENTLTVGVISAKGRSLGLSEATRSFENFVQTDAAINFGNSGGPLLNINGEAVAINTAIKAGPAQGMGFATPINTAKRLLSQLKQGKVVRGYLGMGVDEVDERKKEAFSLPEARGAIVQTVEEGKPAEKAGVKPGDVVMDVDGRPIRSTRDLIDYIAYLPVGTTVKLGIIRDGKKITLTAKTAERPTGLETEDPDGSASAEPVRNRLGMSVQDLSQSLRQLYGIPSSLTGVVVTSVKDVSPAGEAEIGEGDVISEVQGQKIANVEDFRRVVDSLKSGQWIRIYVSTPNRGQRPISGYRTLQVP